MTPSKAAAVAAALGEAASRSARAWVSVAEYLDEFFVDADDAVAAFHVGFAKGTPDDVCSSAQKDCSSLLRLAIGPTSSGWEFRVRPRGRPCLVNSRAWMARVRLKRNLMLISITSTTPDATDLGYLLHKHPDRVRSVDVGFGKAHVFYPEASPERCTATLLVEVDPIALSGGRKGRAGQGLEPYVNDRPYAASSMQCVALTNFSVESNMR